jgi:hypothetical protein
LAGFINQAGLFLADRAISNKLHVSSLPIRFCLLGCFMEQGAGKFNG